MELTETIITVLRVLLAAWCVAVVVFIGLVIAELIDYIKEKKDDSGNR